jgi:dienelactone hydrolase
MEGDIVAWTLRGQAVPSMPRESDDVELDIAEGDPIPLTPYFLKSMESEESLAYARIPVERIAAPVLMISGEADAMWPSTQLAEIAVGGLKAANHAYAYEHVSYPDAGHSIRAPYIPTTVTNMQHPVDGGLYALGGTPEGNARANADSWRRVLDFLNEHLGGKHTP